MRWRILIARNQKAAEHPRRCLRALSGAAIFLLLVAVCAAGNGFAEDQSRENALALEQQGKNTEAETAWRSYLEAHPASSEAYAHLGLLEARQERYGEAVPLYRKAIALQPSIPGLRLNLGLAYFKSGQMKQALEEFAPLLKAAPQSSPDRDRLTILVGMCHYGMGQYTAAVPYLKTASELDPQNLQLLLALAHSYLWSKQYQNVMDVYRQILTLNAESAEADMLAGEALDELKDLPGAIEQFRAAVKADPTMPEVHFGLGYLLYTQRRYAEAAPELQAEIDNNPGHAQALTYLADIDMQLDHPDAAVPLLQKAIGADPEIELAHLDLGIIDAAAGNNESALREMKTAEKLAPGDVNVHWRLGRFYRSTGNQQAAAAELEKARTLTQAADTKLIDKMNPGAQKRQPQ